MRKLDFLGRSKTVESLWFILEFLSIDGLAREEDVLVFWLWFLVFWGLFLVSGLLVHLGEKLLITEENDLLSSLDKAEASGAKEL